MMDYKVPHSADEQPEDVLRTPLSTEQRAQAEVELHRIAARYRAVVDTAADAIIILEPEGRILSYNRGAERIFGYTAEEAIGQSLAILLSSQFCNIYTSGVRLYLETGEEHFLDRTLEVAGQRKGGIEVPLELTVTAVRDNYDMVFTAILRDISERKRLDAERAALLAAEAEQSRRLRELAVLKADFTAMVAHELTSPLAAIRALASMLQTGKIPPDRQAQALALIETESEILTALVKDVQAAAQVERDDFAVQPRAVTLAALLADAAAYAGTLPGDHPLTTALGTTEFVLADPDRIGQVLRNLLNNAAKYSAEGAPIELRSELQGSKVRIEIVDQGFGIEPRDLPRIFEKFGRGSREAGRKIAGIGLGLYLSRRILQAHGTDLLVTSTPGVGSVFAFELQVIA